MKMFGLTGLNVSFAIIATAGLALLPISEGWAQQKCKRSGAYLAQDSKYTEQHVIDVGDVPGHQVRILELHRTPSNAKPNCEGLKVVGRGVAAILTTPTSMAAPGDTTSLVPGERGQDIWANMPVPRKPPSATGQNRVHGYYYVHWRDSQRTRWRKGMSRVTSAFDPKTGSMKSSGKMSVLDRE
jgi:hypothetical protein